MGSALHTCAARLALPALASLLQAARLVLASLLAWLALLGVVRGCLRMAANFTLGVETCGRWQGCKVCQRAQVHMQALASSDGTWRSGLGDL